MAAWFGHTQTLTSISKSVTTVASGILGLEANLATFMQKVGYYETFFERMEPNLPVEVVTTASRLFARCYEYRSEIRDELESSLAYVADAGRWVVGMEDWNSKMEKRLGQINELVLLANTLLIEYAVTGAWGAQGAKDALDGYLRHIADSVVLHNPAASKKRRAADAAVGEKYAPTSDQASEKLVSPPRTNGSTDTTGLQAEVRPSTSSETIDHQHGPPPAPVDSPLMSDNEGELFLARSSTGSGEADAEDGATLSAEESGTMPVLADDDDDVLNPFARAYQPPVSIESSLASLRAESENGSVYFNAMESQQMSVLSGGAGSGGDREDAGDEPDSPVSLGEYECLEMDSIPQYVAFKPTALSRKRRLKQQFFGGPSVTASPSASIESLGSMPASHPTSRPNPSPKGSPRVPNGTRRGVDIVKDRQRLMDLTYSYDFQRELSFNPFASPGMSSISPTGTAAAPHLDLSSRERVPTVEEEEPISEIKEQQFGHDRQRHHEQWDEAPGDTSTATSIQSLLPEALSSEDVEGAIEDALKAITNAVAEASQSEMAHNSLSRSEEDADRAPWSVSLSDTLPAHSPALSEGDELDLTSSIGSDELSAVFYSAPEEFSRLLHDEDPIDESTSGYH